MSASDKQPGSTSASTDRFIPAKPSTLVISLLQNAVRVDLALNNQVFIDQADLDRLCSVPRGMGVILTPNHADETDPKVVLDLSRRCNRRFISMCNREAFDEMGGLAGWGLQRIGHFSVERGAHDAAAKQFAIDTIESGDRVLVIFPEGEIFYLNELVQPFHTGAIELGMQALLAKRAKQPDWTAYIVPMAIKYTYPQPIDAVLAERIDKMERALNLPAGNQPLQKRLRTIMAALLQREEQSHKLASLVGSDTQLGEHVKEVRHAILQELEDKYNDSSAANRRTIDASWELSAKLREMIDHGAEHPTEIRQDLSALHEVAHMVSWQPRYVASNPTRDRMAEVVMKLEREIYHIKRPKPLGARHVYVRISEPIDLSLHLDAYKTDARQVRNELTQSLRDEIQRLIDTMIPLAPSSAGK